MIYALAANIDKLDRLEGSIDRVAAIHAEKTILPRHYPWVGEALFEAIKEVLCEDADDEVVEARREGYIALPKVFIRKEKAYTKGVDHVS